MIDFPNIETYKSSMIGTSGPLRYHWVDKRTIELDAVFSVRIPGAVLGLPGGFVTITAPAGFRTNGASTGLAGLIYPSFASYTAAAIIHDWLYSRQYQEWCRAKGKLALTRAQADQALRWLLGELGESATTQRRFYWSVRAFGWLHYGR